MGFKPHLNLKILIIVNKLPNSLLANVKCDNAYKGINGIKSQ